jgi:alpha-galactosidase
MLEIGNGGMTADEYRSHMSLWSLLAAPLIAGNDLRTMTDETKSILMNSEVIAIDQDPEYRPVTSLSDAGGIEVLMRPLHDGSVAVGIFNRTGQPVRTKFSRSSLPADLTGREIKVRDLWKHEAVELKDGALNTTVPGHGVVLLSFSVQ